MENRFSRLERMKDENMEHQLQIMFAEESERQSEKNEKNNREYDREMAAMKKAYEMELITQGAYHDELYDALSELKIHGTVDEM